MKNIIIPGDIWEYIVTFFFDYNRNSEYHRYDIKLYDGSICHISYEHMNCILNLSLTQKKTLKRITDRIYKQIFRYNFGFFKYSTEAIVKMISSNKQTIKESERDDFEGMFEIYQSSLKKCILCKSYIFFKDFCFFCKQKIKGEIEISKPIFHI